MIAESIEQSSPDDDQLAIVQPPPSSPPTITIGGTTAKLLSYEWYFDGSSHLKRKEPGDDVTAFNLPVVAYAPRGPIQVNANTSVMPLRVETKYFADVDASGIPYGDQGFEGCGDNGHQCQLRVSDGGFSFNISPPDNVKVVIVMTTFATELNISDPSNSPMGDDYASYGVRVHKDE